MDDTILGSLGCSSLEGLKSTPQPEIQDRLSRLFNEGRINEHVLLIGAVEWMAEQVPSIPLVDHLSTSPVIESWCFFLSRLGCPKSMVLSYFTSARERRVPRSDSIPKPPVRLWNFAKRIMDTKYNRNRAEAIRRSRPLCTSPSFSASLVPSASFGPDIPTQETVSREDLQHEAVNVNLGAFRAATPCNHKDHSSMKSVQDIQLTGQIYDLSLDDAEHNKHLDSDSDSPYRKRQKLTERLRSSEAWQIGGTGSNQSENTTMVDAEDFIHLVDDSDSPYRKRQKMTDRLRNAEAQRAYETGSGRSKKFKMVDLGVEKKPKERPGRFWEEWHHDRWGGLRDADREARREKKSRAHQHMNQSQQSESQARSNSPACKPSVKLVRSSRHDFVHPPEVGRLSPWEDSDVRSTASEDPVATTVALTKEEEARIRADAFLDALAEELNARHNSTECAV